MSKSKYETYQVGSRYENFEAATLAGMNGFDQVTKRARDNHYKYQLDMKAKKDLAFVETVERETGKRMDHLREAIYFDKCHGEFPRDLKKILGKYAKVNRKKKHGEMLHDYIGKRIVEENIRYKRSNGIQLTREEIKYVVCQYNGYLTFKPNSDLLSEEIHSRLMNGDTTGEIKQFLKENSILYEPKMMQDIEHESYMQQLNLYKNLFKG